MVNFFLVVAGIIICCLVFMTIIYRNIILNMTAYLENDCNGQFGKKFYNPAYSIKIVKRFTKGVNKLLDTYYEKLEDLNRLKSTQKKILSNLSHDIKTPLTSLMGFVEVIHSDESLTEQEKKEYIDIIYSKALYLSHLVQQFLEFERIESEEYSIDLKSIDICSLIRNFIVLYFVDFKINDITPVIEIPENPILVSADSECLKRILDNLISNVIKHGAEGGKIGLTVIRQEQYVCFEVWDNGSGIPAEKLKYVFNRLYTGDDIRPMAFGSSGLGLSICKRLVEKLGGRIILDSTEGKGTSLKIYLKSHTG